MRRYRPTVSTSSKILIHETPVQLIKKFSYLQPFFTLSFVGDNRIHVDGNVTGTARRGEEIPDAGWGGEGREEKKRVFFFQIGPLQFYILHLF
jgi:hypothetical protein